MSLKTPSICGFHMMHSQHLIGAHLRDSLRERLLDLAPKAGFFVRFAQGEPALLVSDILRRGLPLDVVRAAASQLDLWVWADKGLLWAEPGEHRYEIALTQPLIGTRGPWHSSLYPLQSLALQLLTQEGPETGAVSGQTKALLRAGWHALSGSHGPALRWGRELRAQAAEALRLGQPQGLFACGKLIASFLAAQKVCLPATVPLDLPKEE